MKGPVRVGEELAANRDQVGTAILKDALGLGTIEDGADRHRRNGGGALDRIRRQR